MKLLPIIFCILLASCSSTSRQPSASQPSPAPVMKSEVVSQPQQLAGLGLPVGDFDMGALQNYNMRLFRGDEEMRAFVKYRRVLLPTWWTDDQRRTWWIEHKRKQGL